MTHEERVAIANELFGSLKKIDDIRGKDERTEHDEITLECLGLVDLIKDVVGIEHRITLDADTFALADVLLRSIARHYKKDKPA